MNPVVEKRPITLLINPFYYVAGGKALSLGLAGIVLAGLVGALGQTHFDGVLDTHVGARVPVWVFLAEGIVDWLCLGGVLLVLGRVASKTAFRALDVLGTQALARWPAVVLASLMLPSAFDPTMMKALPEARLRAGWQDAVKQVGPFQKQLKARTVEQAGHRIVLVTCQFEHGALDVKVVYDGQNRVAGLWLVPSGSK